jgi:hypothetical protein
MSTTADRLASSPSITSPAATSAADAVRRPSVLRRVALVAAAVPACALPVIWGGGAAGMLLTGYEPDHRFHQLTGQGVLVGVLWLAGLVPLVVAGWRGRRPSTAAGLQHLAFVAASMVAGLFVPGDGVLALGLIIAVTGALVWAALPLRPRLRGTLGSLDPALAPVAALTTALYVPFVLAQRALQGTSHDEHAQMTHYFDMAWLSLVLVALAVVAAFATGARRLAVWATAGTVVVGAARLGLTGEVPWSSAAIALGLAGTVVAVLRIRAV